MELDDPVFAQAIERLREIARRGASVPELLEFARTSAGPRKTVLACAILYRGLNIPLSVATSLGSWTGFANEIGNPGRSAAELEDEYGDEIRAALARLRSARE